jgi:Tfp pilus assembly protein PilO
MIFKNTKLALIIFSFLALVLAISLSFDIYNIRAENKETSNLLNVADQVAEERVLIQSIKVAQNNAKEDITALNNLVLTTDKLVPTIESIEEAGRALGLEVEIISVAQIANTRAGQPQKINLVIEADGSWSGAISFLYALESLPHRVIIDETNFTKREDGWHARITLALYSFSN